MAYKRDESIIPANEVVACLAPTHPSGGVCPANGTRYFPAEDKLIPTCEHHYRVLNSVNQPVEKVQVGAVVLEKFRQLPRWKQDELLRGIESANTLAL